MTFVRQHMASVTKRIHILCEIFSKKNNNNQRTFSIIHYPKDIAFIVSFSHLLFGEITWAKN